MEWLCVSPVSVVKLWASPVFMAKVSMSHNGQGTDRQVSYCHYICRLPFYFTSSLWTQGHLTGSQLDTYWTLGYLSETLTINFRAACPPLLIKHPVHSYTNWFNSNFPSYFRERVLGSVLPIPSTTPLATKTDATGPLQLDHTTTPTDETASWPDLN